MGNDTTASIRMRVVAPRQHHGEQTVGLSKATPAAAVECGDKLTRRCAGG